MIPQVAKPRVRVKAGSSSGAGIVPVNDGFRSLERSTRGLVNERSGLGTDRDLATGAQWQYDRFHDTQQFTYMYKTNWMARKVVDVPAMDMLRNGWEWEAEAPIVETMETECKRLDVINALTECIKWARLYGGCGLYLGTADEDLSVALDAETLPEGGIKFLLPLPRQYITSSNIRFDTILGHNFREPEYYQIATTTGVSSALNIHPSRIIRFLGNEDPENIISVYDHWADSILIPLEQTIKDVTASQQAIANLLQQASLDIVSIDGLMDGLANDDEFGTYETVLKDRVRTAANMKSTLNTLLLDAKDKWEQRTQNFSTLPEILVQLLQLVSGGADIPATRLMGISPGGMNATGESDLRNYYDRIEAERTQKLCPQMDKLFAFVKASAGVAQDAADYEFKPLWQMDEEKRANINKTVAETATLYDQNLLIPSDALREGVKNRVAADDVFPNFAETIKDLGDQGDLFPAE